MYNNKVYGYAFEKGKSLLENEYARRRICFMIEIKNVTVRCGCQAVINDLTMTVRNGRVTGLVEPNAATRVALLDVIAGVTRPDCGTVKVNGYDVSASPRIAKRQVGYAPVTLPVFDDMTAIEYLQFVAELRGMDASTSEREARDVLDAVSLPPAVAGKLIDGLTPHHRKLLCIATALVGDPEVILVDEPLRELPSANAARIVDLFEALGEEHIVLITASSQERLPAVCEDVFALRRIKDNAENGHDEKSTEEVTSDVDDL